MTASPNLTTSTPKRVLMVIANPSVSTTLGWPVGFWGSELTHPYHEFTEAGYDVTIASPKGGACELDALSDPRDPSEYSAGDLLTMGFLNSPKHMALVEDTPSLDDVDWDAHDAIVVVGGQSPMFTFRGDDGLARAIRAFYEGEKPTAALCHGVSALMDVTLADGSYLITGRTITGFSNEEEELADSVVGQRVMPWRIEDVAKERDANYVSAGAWKAFAIRDGRLVTGQQQYSGRKVAQLIIGMLGT